MGQRRQRWEGRVQSRDIDGLLVVASLYIEIIRPSLPTDMAMRSI